MWADEELTIGFLPFLDILFAALGIFLVILALQQVTNRLEGNRVQADALAVVDDRDRVLWYDLQVV